MRDPYLYDDVPVLKNKLGIKDQEILDSAEADYVVYRLKEIALNKLPGDYHTEHFFRMHEYIFQDLFDWAGQPRNIAIYKEEDVLGGQSVEYSDPFDIVTDVHHVLSDMRSKDWKCMDTNEASKEFCDSLAKLWKIHPFREGNTRTTVTFCCQFIDEQGFMINRELFEKNARYVRTALVAYNAYFSDGSDFSKKEYLEKIVFDSINS
ncbi:Fic/DOC family protein [Butyrivibrio sp. AC2005]|uniref:Fic/DOC family protein n=1 Tax=Butyrivibrio sp. AC2005 TaxID=1280672 RepID=UPI0004233A84|nr:Fic family protein [Butyrivibrio sp. AC2005]